MQTNMAGAIIPPQSGRKIGRSTGQHSAPIRRMALPHSKGFKMQNGLSAMSREQLEAMVAAFQANAKRRLTLKVSKAGAVSLYGFGRWPTTLYKSQWLQVLELADDIRAFIEANDSLLSQGKDDARFPKDE